MICLSYFEIFLKRLNRSAKKIQNTFGLKNYLRGSTKLISYLLALAPNGPEKWGCRIRDIFSKIRDLFSKFETYAVIRDYETKKTAGAAEPPEPPSLAPM